MKKFKVCLAILMIAMMMGGLAWAFDATDHVKVAPNGKGDLLFFPYFFAYPGEYSTKISVINTSNTHSVVAKVTYKSFNFSSELLDHLIYLSPNDVWTGRLVNVDGIARLQSNDDSILSSTPGAIAQDGNFGNFTPVDQPLVLPTCGVVQDANTLGYIEVIEAAARLETKGTTGYQPGERVAKRHIYDWYENYVTSADIANVYQPINVLTGYQENTFGLGATLKQAIVFADYRNEIKIDISASTRLALGANNSLAEIEAAMGKLDVAQPYIAKANGDSSVHIFNFPTKLSLENPASTCTLYAINQRSPYWLLVNSKCESYTRNIYDLMEHTPAPGAGEPFSPTAPNPVLSMCGEVQFNVQQLIADPTYTEGWIRYNFGKSVATKSGLTKSGAPIDYTGTPVLATVLYWSAERENPAEANSAYTDGKVSVANLAQPYYQYSE